MAKQEFDLFQIAPVLPAEFGAGAAEVVRSEVFNPALLQHVSPLGWEHVNLTGDYTWHTNRRVAKGGFRPLRIPRTGFAKP